MEKVRYGIIGIGNQGKNQRKTLRKNTEQIKLFWFGIFFLLIVAFILIKTAIIIFKQKY